MYTVLGLIKIVTIFVYKHFLQAAVERVEGNKSTDFENKFVGD
jgi:hypothetical protein